MSRVLPTLIRLNNVIRSNTSVRTYFSNPRHSLNKLRLETSPTLLFKTMTTDLEKELKDPKRHFDYNQLVQKKDKENAIVIDVREHEEINETGKIPGSIHIPLADLAKSLGEMSPEEFQNKYKSNKPSKDDEIIFSCKAGGRSMKALKIGLELGYNKAGNYKGGWLDWAEKSKQS